MKKIYIENKYRGSVHIPQNKESEAIIFRVKQAYANHEALSVSLLFRPNKLERLNSYMKGGAQDELDHLDMYIALGEMLAFNTDDAKALKKRIHFTNDSAHSNYNITKRVKLVNKQKKSKTKESYLFWDIENFSNISSIFSDVIEPYNIEDERIYMAANPDSLYLKKAEWEANLYDYQKTLQSFNFTKCDHGKNVADDVLLNNFQKLNLKGCDIFMLSFDRELKERFVEVCDKSNNMYVMTK